MHRIIHTFKKILQLLFNRTFLCCSCADASAYMVVDHRMETGSIFKIYFACNQYDQHPGRTLDRKQKDQSVL